MENLIDKLESFSNTPPQTLSPSTQSSLSEKPRILGIFTGQGAQWAGMGADLLTSYPFAKKCIDDLDSALQSLCEQDRPNWSLYSEILTKFFCFWKAQEFSYKRITVNELLDITSGGLKITWSKYWVFLTFKYCWMVAWRTVCFWWFEGLYIIHMKLAAAG